MFQKKVFSFFIAVLVTGLVGTSFMKAIAAQEGGGGHASVAPMKSALQRAYSQALRSSSYREDPVYKGEKGEIPLAEISYEMWGAYDKIEKINFVKKGSPALNCENQTDSHACTTKDTVSGRPVMTFELEFWELRLKGETALPYDLLAHELLRATFRDDLSDDNQEISRDFLGLDTWENEYEFFKVGDTFRTNKDYCPLKVVSKSPECLSKTLLNKKNGTQACGDLFTVTFENVRFKHHPCGHPSLGQLHTYECRYADTVKGTPAFCTLSLRSGHSCKIENLSGQGFVQACTRNSSASYWK